MKHIYYLLGRYHAWRKHWVRATRYYARVIELSGGGNPEVHHRLGYSLLRRKKYQQALKEFDKAHELGYRSSYYRLRRGQCLVKIGRVEEALKDVSSVADKFPERYVPNRTMGDILLQDSQYDRAVGYYEKALNAAIEKSDVPKVRYIYHSLGYAHELMGDRQAPTAFYDKAIENDTSLGSRELGIGVLHQSRKFWDSALVAYEEKLLEQPDNSEIYYRMGAVYSGMSRYAEAAGMFAKFVELDRQSGQADYELNDKIIIFESFMGRGYSCSPKAIYEQLLSDPEYSDYSFVWAFRNPSKFKHLEGSRTQLVKYRSHDYFRLYSKSRYWFTNSRLPYIEKTDDRQIYVQCWHGTPLKRLGHDIIENTEHAKFSKKEFSDTYDRETVKFDYFLSPSGYASERFKAAFNLDGLSKGDIIVEEGYPRNDRLKTYSPNEVKELKRGLGVHPSKKILLYAPTWRDNSYEENTGYTFKTEADFDYLQEKLGDDWVILFRAHYFIANEFDFGKYNGFVVDVSGVSDVNDLYIVSDALMTDYSSVFFDYANLSRPMLFFMYDLDMYKNNLRGFYIDLEELPGDIVKEESEIVDILSDLESYSLRQQDKYRKFTERFTYLDDGKASERVIERIIEKGEYPRD